MAHYSTSQLVKVVPLGSAIGYNVGIQTVEAALLNAKSMVEENNAKASPMDGVSSGMLQNERLAHSMDLLQQDVGARLKGLTGSDQKQWDQLERMEHLIAVQKVLYHLRAAFDHWVPCALFVSGIKIQQDSSSARVTLAPQWVSPIDQAWAQTQSKSRVMPTSVGHSRTGWLVRHLNAGLNPHSVAIVWSAQQWASGQLDKGSPFHSDGAHRARLYGAPFGTMSAGAVQGHMGQLEPVVAHQNSLCTHVLKAYECSQKLPKALWGFKVPPGHPVTSITVNVDLTDVSGAWEQSPQEPDPAWERFVRALCSKECLALLEREALEGLTAKANSNTVLGSGTRIKGL